MVDLLPPSVSDTDKRPQQSDPDVDQDEGKGYKQQPNRWIFGGRANPAMILDSIAGLNAKSFPLLGSDSSQSDFHPINYIE